MISKLTIDDIYLGQQFVLKKQITRELIQSFSELTGDYHPLHSNDKYAELSGFDNIIAQGFLAAAFLSYVVGMKLPGENALILSQDCKFLKPIYVDQEITYVCEIRKIDRRFSMLDLGYDVLLPNAQKAISGNVKIKIRQNAI